MLSPLITDIVPAIVIVLCNVWGGEPGTPPYDRTTAWFGWAAGLTMIPALIMSGSIFREIFLFSLIAALSRDYEPLLRRVRDKWHRRRGS
jgi:hypothetical protein